MQNTEIAKAFKLLARLTGLHDDNQFRMRSYYNAADEIEMFHKPLEEMAEDEIKEIPGIGPAIADKIQSLLKTGEIPKVQELLSITPPGVIDISRLRGVGAKKVLPLWKVHGIDTIEALKKACQEGKVAEMDGFGEKTQDAILEAIEDFQPR